jgi:DNA-binding MarR family transcriptional regulator
MEVAGNCSPQFVRRVLAARAARRQFFNPDLFADPAWDILLELYALRCEQHRTSVSKLCIAAAVPTTTALRWIEKLQAEGLLEREADKNDGRRIWVGISDSGFESVKAYLQRHGGLAPL